MNTLTKNRILQKGDEYRDNGEWKAVPKNDYGLQIQFTPYAEVRRPSEQPFPVTPTPNTDASRLVGQGSPSNDSHPAPTARKVQTSEGVKRSPSAGTTSGDKPERAASGRESTLPISPDNVATATAAPNVAKAGSDRNPVVSHSATGDASYLPTIVSKKAHMVGVGIKYDSGEIVKTLGETPETVNDARTEVAKSPVSPTPLTGDVDPATGSAPPVKAAYDGNGLIKITFPKPDPTNLIEMSEQPIWTGRNGTFTGYGLEAMTVTSNIMLSPIGKRGVGNCTIQFPKAIIPELIDWLKKQTPK